MDDLQQQIIDILERCVRQTAKEYHQNLIRNVIYNIYNAPASPYYDRTEGFLKSLSQGFYVNITPDGECDIQISDESLIKSFNGAKGKFGHHKSFPWNEPYPSNEEVKENLFDWLDSGFTILGKKYHSGYHFDVPEESFFNNFVSLATKEIKRFLKERR